MGEQELSYKLATRAAFLLGQNIQERKDIYKILTWAYNFRSRIVHGGSSKDRRKDMNEIELSGLINNFLLTRDLLRRSILEFLRLTEKYNHDTLIRTLLDQNVLEEGLLLRNIH
jgi:hypothetical protein